MTTDVSVNSSTQRPPIDTPSTESPYWRWAGSAAAVTAIAGLVLGSGVDAVYAEASKNDPEKIAEAILDSSTTVALFHTTTTIAALLLMVFAAGLHRRISRATPSSSILAQITSAGLLLTAVAQIIGTSLDTEFTQGARGNITPDAITFYGHWINTVSWCWAGAGLAGLAVAVAALAHGAFARWIGFVSLALGGVTTLFAISPLEYMAAMTGALWLLVVTTGLLLDRRTATARRAR